MLSIVLTKLPSHRVHQNQKNMIHFLILCIFFPTFLFEYIRFVILAIFSVNLLHDLSGGVDNLSINISVLTNPCRKNCLYVYSLLISSKEKYNVKHIASEVPFGVDYMGHI